MTHDEPVVAESVENPYSPAAAISEGEEKSGGLMVISILAIILGSMGALAAIMGIVSLAVGDQMMAATPGPMGPGNNAEIQRIMQEMQAEMMAVGQRYRPLTIAVVIAGTLTSIGLISGGIRALRRGVSGCGLLKKALLLALVVDILRLIPTMLPQREMMGVYDNYMRQFGELSGGPAEAMQAIGKIGIIVGLVVAIGLFLVKAVFYVIGYVIITRRQQAANAV